MYGMNNKIRDVLFFIICISLIFNNIPKPIQMNFIGGPVGSKLVFYPLIIGMLYTFWCDWKYKNILIKKKQIIKFLRVYIGITFLSLLVGLTFYPFFNDILNGPVAQIEKLPRVLEFFNSKGINFEAETILPLWMIARMIKGFFLEIFYTFVAAYIFYCWYRDEWKTAFKIIVKAILCSVGILFVYSFLVEIPYLAGSEGCKHILEAINPFIHSIKDDGKWWPPLLWKGQLRSVFAEPSYFGIYTAFAMPFLWYFIYNDKKIIGTGFTILLSFLLFLTKARTGFMLLIGELVLLSVFITFWGRDKVFLKKTGLLFLCILVSFVGSNYFIANHIDNKTINFVKLNNNKVIVKKETGSQKKAVDLQKSVNAYIDSNATSLVNPDKRSNRARYSIMEADFRIGLAHPILGVGRGLRNGYIPQYLPEKGKQNGEVKMWLAFREKLGILKSGFPTLGEYTVRFAETGILGLSAFLVPVLFLIFSMVKKIMCKNFQYKLEYGMFLISLLGIMASGIGDTLNITYCYWVLLGLGYAMCFGKAGDEKDINERT